MKIIGTVSTIPSRIDKIIPTLKSVLDQDVKVDHIEINVPVYCDRLKTSYSIPKELRTLTDLQIYRTSDYGPITKVAPTFFRHLHEDVYIFSFDDDIIYAKNHLTLMLNDFGQFDDKVIARHGGMFTDKGITPYFGTLKVDYIEGYGGVLYPMKLIDTSFIDYLFNVLKHKPCILADDIVLSHFFRAKRIPLWISNNKDSNGFNPEITKHSKLDALKDIGNGHVSNYNIVKEILNLLIIE
jgi:hypothetical protein